MTALSAWASDLVCETHCEACQRPHFLTLPNILQAQPVRCACGRSYAPATPPGLPEITALLAALEYAAAHDRAIRIGRVRMAQLS